MRVPALIPIALVASACTEPGPPPRGAAAIAQGNQTTMTSPSAPMVEVATYRSNGIIASSRLEGTLVVIEGCIMLQSPSYPDGALVFFPEGQARWNPDDNSLTIGPDRFRLGAKIVLTGGASSISNYEGRVNVPRQCARTGGFFAAAKAIILK